MGYTKTPNRNIYIYIIENKNLGNCVNNSVVIELQSSNKKCFKRRAKLLKPE